MLLFATLLASLILAVASIVLYVTVHRMSPRLRLMADVPCPRCRRPLGIRAVKNGIDYSPFEIFQDIDGELVHHQPDERRVECRACGERVQVRLNLEGERFGPRLSAEGKAASSEKIADLKSWDR